MERVRERNLLAGKKKASELRKARRGVDLAQHRQEVRVFVSRYASGGGGGERRGGVGRRWSGFAGVGGALMLVVL